MACLVGCIYVAWQGNHYRIGWSPRPKVDARLLLDQGYTDLQIVSPQIPIGIGDYLLRQIASKAELQGTDLCAVDEPSSVWKWIIRKRRPGVRAISELRIAKIHSVEQQLTALYRENYSARLNAETVQPSLTLSDPTDLDRLVAILEGRLLLEEEILQALKENGWTNCPVEVCLAMLVLQGRCVRVPAVYLEDAHSPRCSRCGQNSRIEQIHCGSCGSDFCFTCAECLSMGEAKLCVPLYGLPGNTTKQPSPGRGTLTLGFPLTPAQKAASGAIRSFVELPNRQEACLVWAVCGAGKTEVVFSGIASALERGERVLFAIPRKDVVIELEPRLRQAFPKAMVGGLYGGSTGKYQRYDIVIATTHQTIRFYRDFDLVVLDEVDAFPYHGSAMLYHAVARARKSEGKIIYMTATPDKSLIRRAEKGDYALVRIPARHHGYPVPEPHFVRIPGRRRDAKAWKVPCVLLDFLVRCGRQGQAVFVFVPSIQLAEEVGQALAKELAVENMVVEFSHSRDARRDEKRERFCNGEFPVFVTTTIMERGITVSNVQVVVLFADSAGIFDERALVQMAGRVGRSEEYPTGEVVYMAEALNEEIDLAQQRIQKMNDEARRYGYLKN